MPPRLLQLGRWGVRALRIAASTIALIEVLRSDWRGGGAATLAWLVFIQVERRLNRLEPHQAEHNAP